jgi:polyferredoxin
MKPLSLQTQRLLWRSGFFILFVIAPIFDIFRLDLTLGHFIVLGFPWTLGLDAFKSGEITALQAGFNIVLRVFLPLGILVITFLWIAWKYGRLYCGWLCPHFSVVEMINDLMRRASGKQSIWDKYPLPELQSDGSILKPNKKYWWLVYLAVISFAFLWAVAFLTYLLPPKEIYYNLFHATLTRNQMIFLSAATFLLSIEFMFARHLFCRFACAVGLFQSLAWMSNDRAMVVGFNTKKVKACIDCNAACDNVCPMRLKPRSMKRKMFTCTQCAQCVQACTQVQKQNSEVSLLQWVSEEAAQQVATDKTIVKSSWKNTSVHSGTVS